MELGLRGSITSRITEYGFNIFCIDTGFLRPQLAACYLIIEDDSAAIIETGTANCVSGIAEVVDYLGIGPDKVLYVMPTHVHLDHAGGAGSLMQLYPHAKLVIHPRGERHMIDPEKLWLGASEVYGAEQMHRLYGEVIPVDKDRIIVADDKFVLDFKGRKLLFLDTPGHARHHYSIYDETSNGFFTGDTFGMAYRELHNSGRYYIMPTTTPIQFDPDAWYETLDKYLAMNPARMFLTHFGMVEDVEVHAADLRGRLEKYAQIATDCVQSENRIKLIQEKITRLSMDELSALQLAMPAAAIQALLGMDFELNAAGLESWLTSRA